MVTQGLEARYHFAITADRQIKKWQTFSDQLTQMMNRLKPLTMQMIHITTEPEFNVANRLLKAQGKTSFKIQPEYNGECYIQNTDNYLIYREYEINPAHYEVVPFDEFLKQVA